VKIEETHSKTENSQEEEDKFEVSAEIKNDVQNFKYESEGSSNI
jgi:hypothetical protein